MELLKVLGIWHRLLAHGTPVEAQQVYHHSCRTKMSIMAPYLCLACGAGSCLASPAPSKAWAAPSPRANQPGLPCGHRRRGGGTQAEYSGRRYALV